MKIEVGKRYINTEGKIVDIIKYELCDFISKDDIVYHLSGRWNRYMETPQDLICEVVDDIIIAWKEGYIETWRDVIQSHIDWWTYKNVR
jgi:hypothetical protein